MRATLVPALPEGTDWLYEVKFDGYRAIAIKDGARVQIRSRNDKNLTAAYPSVVQAVGKLPAESAILDGEIVAVGESGRPSFQALQHRSEYPQHHVVLYAFDLLLLNGELLTALPLEQRRAMLPGTLRGSGVLLSEVLPGTAAQVVAAVGELGLEGVIAKRRDSRYQSGIRSDAWRKLKLDRQQEFVVGGYRPNGRSVDALIVGYYDDDGELRCAGKVRAGFTPHLRAQIGDQLEPLKIKKCPFVDLPNAKISRWGAGITADEMLEMQWVRPRLVVQIRFVEWTAEGHLRHAAFMGVREDKLARDVKRES